jgi:hypothetical protein
MGECQGVLVSELREGDVFGWRGAQLTVVRIHGWSGKRTIHLEAWRQGEGVEMAAPEGLVVALVARLDDAELARRKAARAAEAVAALREFRRSVEAGEWGDEPEWTDEDLEINTATNAAARADELEDARAEVAALTYLLEGVRKELDDARTGRDIAAVYDEMERMRVALERERDNAREAANIRMAELGEEIDQLKEEADRREAVIVKMREALSVAGVCDLCGEEVERLAGLEGGEG